MRGIYNSVTDLRRQVFTAIASMAYDDNTDYSKRMEEIPYEILPGTKAKYRDSIFLERAIIGERLRLGMGLPVRDITEYTNISDGIEESTIAKNTMMIHLSTLLNLHVMHVQKRSICHKRLSRMFITPMYRSLSKRCDSYRKW